MIINNTKGIGKLYHIDMSCQFAVSMLYIIMMLWKHSKKLVGANKCNYFVWKKKPYSITIRIVRFSFLYDYSSNKVLIRIINFDLIMSRRWKIDIITNRAKIKLKKSLSKYYLTSRRREKRMSNVFTETQRTFVAR